MEKLGQAEGSSGVFGNRLKMNASGERKYCTARLPASPKLMVYWLYAPRRGSIPVVAVPVKAFANDPGAEVRVYGPYANV